MKNRAIKLASLVFLCFLFCLSGCKSSSVASDKTYTENEIITLIFKYNLSKTTNASFEYVYSESIGGSSYEMLSDPIVTEIVYPFDGKKAYFADFTFTKKSWEKPRRGIILCSDYEFKGDSFRNILKIKKGDKFKMVQDFKYYGKEVRIAWIRRAGAPLVGH